MKRPETKVIWAAAVSAVVLVLALWLGFARPNARRAELDASQGQVAAQDEALSEREEFVGAWAPSIDAFNAGYPLEGYGAAFAEAAYDFGVDPRLSPAIARVESGSGQNYAYACNAWGWGTASWGDWESAIYAHVEGLATNYGTELDWGMAARYCPEHPDDWYAQVEGCMAQMG